MPRIPRIYLEEGLYYVVARGNYGGNIFKDDRDCQRYLELLEKYKAQRQFKLFAYYLISNSVILLIQTVPGITISDIMRDLSSNYTKYFNGRYNKRGHLFQSRFKAVLIEAKYLKEITRYIHSLPFMQKIASQPEAYKWSSYPAYLGLSENCGLGVNVDIDTAYVLEQFSLDTQSQAGLYKEFINSAKISDMQDIKRKLQRSYIIGSKEFIDKAKKERETALKNNMPREELMKNKLFIVSSAAAVLVLAAVTFYFYRVNLSFRERFSRALENKKMEFREQLSKQRDFVKKDLEEKYRADIVSYQAMEKRLQIEQKKTDELNRKLKNL